MIRIPNYALSSTRWVVSNGIDLTRFERAHDTDWREVGKIGNRREKFLWCAMEDLIHLELSLLQPLLWPRGEPSQCGVQDSLGPELLQNEFV